MFKRGIIQVFLNRLFSHLGVEQLEPLRHLRRRRQLVLPVQRLLRLLGLGGEAV